MDKLTTHIESVMVAMEIVDDSAMTMLNWEFNFDPTTFLMAGVFGNEKINEI